MGSLCRFPFLPFAGSGAATGAVGSRPGDSKPFPPLTAALRSVAVPKPDGSLYGQGEGVFASLNGEMATWHGMGTGAFGPDGSVRHRGTLSFSSGGATLAKLNSAVVLFDFTIDAQGNTQSTFWDWKA